LKKYGRTVSMSGKMIFHQFLVVSAIVLSVAAPVSTRSTMRAKSIGPQLNPPINLDAWYAGYNEKYWGGELPNDVVITRNLHDDRFMAITVPTGRSYEIDLNMKYLPSPKEEKETLLHETCHIQIFVEDTPEINDHGPKWQACMHRITKEGAMEDLW